MGGRGLRWQQSASAEEGRKKEAYTQAFPPSPPSATATCAWLPSGASSRRCLCRTRCSGEAAGLPSHRPPPHASDSLLRARDPASRRAYVALVEDTRGAGEAACDGRGGEAS